MELAQVNWQRSRHPAHYVNYVRLPAELFNRLDDGFAEKQRARTIVVVKGALGVFPGALALEVLLVINEVDLNLGSRNGCNFNDQRLVVVVNDHVDSAQTNDFVKLVAAFVDNTESGHEGANLMT